MQRLALVLTLVALAATAMAGSLAPGGPQGPQPDDRHMTADVRSGDGHLYRSSVPAAAPACPPPAPTARVAAGHVALAWEPCAGATWRVLRGPSVAELVPLVEVAHAGHVDVGAPSSGVVAYAVEVAGGARGAAVVVEIPRS